jgi:hypothetical protein
MFFGNSYRPSCIYYATKLLKIIRTGGWKRATKIEKTFCRCTIQGKRGTTLTRFDIYNKPLDLVGLQKWLVDFKALPRCPIMGSNEELNGAGLQDIDNACNRCPRRLRYEQQNANEISAVKLESRNF